MNFRTLTGFLMLTSGFMLGVKVLMLNDVDATFAEDPLNLWIGLCVSLITSRTGAKEMRESLE